MFAGLSFPDAPSSSVVVKSTTVPGSSSTADADNTDHVHANIKPKEVHNYNRVEEVEMRDRPLSSADTTEHRWGSLYAEDQIDRNTTSVYPTVPIVPDMRIRPYALHTEAQNNTGPDDLNDTEQVPLLGGGDTDGRPMQQFPPTLSLPQLPTEATQQNQQNPLLPPGVQGHDISYPCHGNGIQQQYPQNIRQHQQQNTMQMHHPPPITGSSSSTTGIENAGTTNHPQVGKYVCCGQCKQWMTAPKDIRLVHCSKCNVINNCDNPVQDINRCVLFLNKV